MFISIGEYIEYMQPEVFAQLAMYVKPVKRKKEVRITFEDAERLMRHDSYKRVRGAVRQTRRV